MNNQSPQPNVDQIRGNLGFITNMHEQLLQHKAGKQQASQTPQKPQNEPAQAPEPKPQETPHPDEMAALETKMEAKMEIMRKELKDTMTTEVSSLRQTIMDALANEKD